MSLQKVANLPEVRATRRSDRKLYFLAEKPPEASDTVTNLSTCGLVMASLRMAQLSSSGWSASSMKTILPTYPRHKAILVC